MHPAQFIERRREGELLPKPAIIPLAEQKTPSFLMRSNSGTDGMDLSCKPVVDCIDDPNVLRFPDPYPLPYHFAGGSLLLWLMGC